MKVKKKKKKDFFFSIGKTEMVLGKGGYFGLGMGRNLAPREGQKMPCIVTYQSFLDLTKHLV